MDFIFWSGPFVYEELKTHRYDLLLFLLLSLLYAWLEWS